MSMKRTLGITAALVLALAVSGYAQKPDFSGTWTLDAEASGMTGGGGGRGMMAGPMTVKQTDDTLSIERQGRNGNTMTQSYKLDGTETEINMGRMSGKATAKWEDNKLVITTKTDMGERTETWSMDGGNLTIESTGGRGAGKRVYKKSS
jgi:hypothetical protein